MVLIVDVDEPSVRICATVNLGAYIRAHMRKLVLTNLNIKTESADQLYCCTCMFSAAQIVYKYL